MTVVGAGSRSVDAVLGLTRAGRAAATTGRCEAEGVLVGTAALGATATPASDAPAGLEEPLDLEPSPAP